MSLISAEGIHVRHAIARALATVNQSIFESTWRIVTSRVRLDPRGRIAEGSVTLRVERPRPLDGPLDDLYGLVNPDGQHPLMALVRGCDRLLMDIVPVTWERWTRLFATTQPPDLDAWCARTDVRVEEARAYARAVHKRLPTETELSAAWGPATLPWGDQRDPAAGRLAPPRWGEIPEVAAHPPNRGGFFDLGVWLGQWTEGGTLVGLEDHAVASPAPAGPVGFRCVEAI